MPTVKVRVAVAVDREGNWCSAGWQEATDEDKRGAAAEHVQPGERIYWLTADLQIPIGDDPVDVPADVEADKPSGDQRR